jgi:hypothetical protein
MSLKLALEQLGFGPCHHMSEIVLDPSTAGPWIEAAEGRPDWEKVFKGYASGVDVPTAIFWRELSEVYPAAKLILTVRDPDAWFDSTQMTVLSPRMQARQQVLAPLGEFFAKVMGRAHGGDETRIHDRAFMTDYFVRHNAEVIATIPKERLLVFEVTQGWDPLCAFLGVAVPSTPFPSVNSRADMAAMLGGSGGPGGPPDMTHVQETLRKRLGKT